MTRPNETLLDTIAAMDEATLNFFDYLNSIIPDAEDAFIDEGDEDLLTADEWAHYQSVYY